MNTCPRSLRARLYGWLCLACVLATVVMVLVAGHHVRTLQPSQALRLGVPLLVMVVVTVTVVLRLYTAVAADFVWDDQALVRRALLDGWRLSWHDIAGLAISLGQRGDARWELITAAGRRCRVEFDWLGPESPLLLAELQRHVAPLAEARRRELERHGGVLRYRVGAEAWLGVAFFGLLAVAMLALYIFEPNLEGAVLVGMTLLVALLLSAANRLTRRYELRLDERGLTENSSRPPRSLAWAEVETVVLARQSSGRWWSETLTVSGRGTRIVLSDSLSDYLLAAELILRRTPHAPFEDRGPAPPRPAWAELWRQVLARR